MYLFYFIPFNLCICLSPVSSAISWVRVIVIKYVFFFLLFLLNVLYGLKKKQKNKITPKHFCFISFLLKENLSYSSALVKREEGKTSLRWTMEEKRRNEGIFQQDFIICGHQYAG